MGEFAAYYVEFLKQVGINIWNFIKTLFVDGIYQFLVLDVIGYFKQLMEVLPSFDMLGWIMLIITSLVLFTLIFFLIYRLVQLIRRYVIFRAKEVDKDKLMEEITRLKMQANELSEEKKKIFALKVNGRVGGGEAEAGNSDATSEANSLKPIKDSRFTKLINLDERYERNPIYIFMEEEDMLPLDQIVDRFINYAASQLKLYYNHRTVRQFFAGLATSKIIILEGISGTGKTSLPYALAKFFNNNASICSVQPSFRDRSELLGYFNEFTKKFNETDFLSSLYESTLREDPNFIVLDEMNLARIEYYFADFLSIMEMPDVAEWKIDLVPTSLATDPKNIIYGKLLVPQNVWFIGTANNDDSTFTITDKVYDRAVALELNTRAGYFDAEMTQTLNCTASYLEALFDKAQNENPIKPESLALITELDRFVQAKFKISFGNRILKQIKLFVPAYVACGGDEMEAIDFMLKSKILRKFTSLNLPFLTNELAELITFIEKKFGKGVMKLCVEYIEHLQHTN